MAREEMRLPERQKALLDASGARNVYHECILSFLTLPTTLFTTLCAYYEVIFTYRPIGLITIVLVVRSLGKLQTVHDVLL